MHPRALFCATHDAAPLRRNATFTLLLTALLVVAVALPAAAAPSVRPFGPGIDRYAAYDGQRTCQSTAQPGVVDFRAIVLGAYSVGSGGGIVRYCGSGGKSEHKEGRAWDWMVNAGVPAERAAADDLVAWLLATDEHGNSHAMARRFGVMYIIWNRRIWKSWEAGKGWQAYSGTSPHTDHVHFSFSWAGARKQTSFWTAPTYTPPSSSTSEPPERIAAVENPGPFPDVAEGSIWDEPVTWMRDEGITSGRASGFYDLGATLERGMMATFLHRLMDSPAATSKAPFSDVAAGDYFSVPVDWLAEAGITHGTTATTFSPHDPVTRGQLALLLWRLAGEPAPSSEHSFSDVPDAYDVAVSWLSEHGITTGVSEDEFAPGRAITRAQVALLLWRLAGEPAAWDGVDPVPSTTRF